MAISYTGPLDNPKDPIKSKKPFQATVEDASDIDLAKPANDESDQSCTQKHEQNTSAPRSILKNKNPKPSVHFSRRPVSVRRSSEGASGDGRQPSIPGVVGGPVEDNSNMHHGIHHRKLRRFLKAVAQNILDTYTNGSTVFTPETMFNFYTDFDLGKKEHNLLHFKELFKPRDDMDTNTWVDLQVFYQALQCEQHLVQLQAHGDPFIPALTVGGFIHFITLLIDACPSTESRRLLDVAEKLNITPTNHSIFPSIPDLKATEKLRRVFEDWMAKRLYMMAGNFDPQASLEYSAGSSPARHPYPTPEPSPRSSRLYDYDEPYHVIVEEPRRKATRRHASPEDVDNEPGRSWVFSSRPGKTYFREGLPHPNDKWYYDSSSPSSSRSVDTTRAEAAFPASRASGRGRRRYSEHAREGAGHRRSGSFTSGDGRYHRDESSVRGKRNSDAKSPMSMLVDGLFGGRSRRGSESRYEDGRGHSMGYYRKR